MVVDMFKIIETKEEFEKYFARPLFDENAGAHISFEGKVRRANEGKQVLKLFYEAYKALAEKEANKIIEEARFKFNIINVISAHRVGSLDIQDTAIKVVLQAKHRKASYKAIQYIVDKIKARVPIWKKEFYEGGDYKWVACHHCVNPSEFNSEIYSRQTSIKQIGLSGQKLLQEVRILVVGAGGLGTNVLRNLAYLGFRKISICEFDTVSSSNLNRQTFYNLNDINQSKLEISYIKLKEISELIDVNLIDKRLEENNAKHIVAEHDLILDCTDNLETKLLLNRIVLEMNKTLITASIYDFSGSLQIINGSNSCLQCFSTNENHLKSAYQRSNTTVTTANFLATVQANEALKLSLDLKTDLDSKLLLINLLDNEFKKILRKKDPNCFCSKLGNNLETRGEFSASR